MSILELLKRDHEAILRDLRRIVEAERTSERRARFADLVELVEGNIAFKEEVVYPRILTAAPADLSRRIDEKRQAGGAALELLRKLEEGFDETPEWSEGIVRLQRLLENGIEQEEGGLFPSVRSCLSPGALQKMAMEYERRTALRQAAE